MPAPVDCVHGYSARPGGQCAAVKRNAGIECGLLSRKLKMLSQIRKQPTEAEEKSEVRAEVLEHHEDGVPGEQRPADHPFRAPITRAARAYPVQLCARDAGFLRRVVAVPIKPPHGPE